jgi:cell wall-associated NlpC family hydrolase
MITADEIIDKYLGKRIGVGPSVCFRFVKEVLRQEFGFVLQDDYLEMLGRFKQIHSPKLGDIVLMRTHPVVPNHVGIYLRDGKFIHCGLRQSGEVVLSDVKDVFYGMRIVAFLRYR